MIRNLYEKYGSPENYYKNHSHNYQNPHLPNIQRCLDYVMSSIEIGFFLDAGCGNGECSVYLNGKGYRFFKGFDPYLDEMYTRNTGRSCLKVRFEEFTPVDYYNTIIASYSLHLCEPSYMATVLLNFAYSCNHLVVISPSKYPIINEQFLMQTHYTVFNRTHCRIYKSLLPSIL